MTWRFEDYSWFGRLTNLGVKMVGIEVAAAGEESGTTRGRLVMGVERRH